MSNAEYVPISVEHFIGRERLDFDVFLQLGGKFVLYVRKGSAFDSSKIEKMKEKSVNKVYLRQEDGVLFQQEIERLNAQRIKEAYDPRAPLSLEERAKIIHDEQRSNAEAFVSDIKDPSVYHRVSEGARRFSEFVQLPGALRAILQVSSEKTIAAHGVRVAAYAVAIAKETGTSDPKELHLLALGCLLHDSGHFDSGGVSGGVSGDDFATGWKDLNADRQKVYKDHPERVVRVAQGLAHFDLLVLKIILEHEEHIDGSGYPKGLHERQLHPLSVIAATANAFDRFVAFDREPFQSACKRLVVEKIGRHPLAHINILKKISQEMV